MSCMLMNVMRLDRRTSFIYKGEHKFWIKYIMAFCSNDLFVSFVCFVLSTSSVFSDGDGRERFPQKLFCSKDGSGFCFHVLSGHVDSMQARNVCSNIGGKLIDFRKSMLLEQVSKVLSDNAGSSEQLIALNARREDYSKMIDIQGREIEAHYGWRKAIVMERKDKWYLSYRFEYSSDNITSIQKAVCVYPSDRGCEGGIRTSDNRCLIPTQYRFNWFDARRYCVLMGGDLATLSDIPETSQPFPYISEAKYWMGASTLSWQWGSFRGDVQLFSATPKWDVNYFEKESTSCAAILVKKMETNFSTEWRAVSCSDNRNFSIICEFYGSYVLPSELNSRTADYTAAIVVTLVTLAILAGVVILVYYKRKSVRSRMMRSLYVNDKRTENITSTSENKFVEDEFQSKVQKDVKSSKETSAFPPSEPECDYSKLESLAGETHVYTALKLN